MSDLPNCETIGCKNKADFKITTLDNKHIHSCSKHENITLDYYKDNIFNIILLNDFDSNNDPRQ